MAGEFTIDLIGTPCVGKSTFIERINIGTFRKAYQPDRLTQELSLTFNTNYGLIDFHTREISDYLDFESYHPIADGAIVMFSVDSRESFETAEHSMDSVVHRPRGDIPTVICGNKADLKRPVVMQRLISTRRDEWSSRYSEDLIHYYHISAKSNYNIGKPILWLARKLTGHEDLLLL